MTGPQHYLEAERLLKSAAKNFLSTGKAGSALEAAQVHATLALAAATALSSPVDGEIAGLTVEQYDAWFKATGPRPETVVVDGGQ